MAVIYVVLPLSLVLVALAVGVFIWSVRSGQLDDLDSPAVRMLYDDEPPLRRQTTTTRGSDESGQLE